MPKFDLPAIASKEVSSNTLKIYKSKLNKLANAGYNSIDAITADPFGVIKAIDAVCDGPTTSNEHQPISTCKCPQCKTREAKRLYYSSVFYALADSAYINAPNPLFDEFQRQKQNYQSH